MSELANAAMLRHVLIKMEDDLGLRDLSPSERDVYYAAVTLWYSRAVLTPWRPHAKQQMMPLGVRYGMVG